MDTFLKEISSLAKYPNDSKIQQKQITILKEILEIIKKLEKKKITEIQTSIEDTLYNIIIQSRANSDIVTRYIYYILKHLFEFGLGSHINDFIIKYSSLLNSKASTNIKCTALWLMGKVCSKAEYKSPSMGELVKTLIKQIKNSSDLTIKTQSLWVISSLLNLKLPFFHIQSQDILKLILKQDKYFTNKKNIIKVLNANMFYLNQQLVEKNYDLIIALLTKCFDDSNESIRELGYETYISMHNEKVFDSNIVKQKIIRKRDGEPLKNFLEVVLYFGTTFTSRPDTSTNIKLSYLEILRRLFVINKDYLNSSESLVTKVYDLLLNDFPLVYECNDGINQINTRKKNKVNSNENKDNDDPINKSIEMLYRCYIKVIYNVVYRKNLLSHLIKRLEDSQFDMDKIENSSLSITSTKSSQSSGGNKPRGQKRDKKYTEFQVNAMIISLVEFSEDNYDLFELNYKSFQDLANNISVYVTSSIRSFRMLISKVLANLAYFLPSWRISILTLVLNLSSVAHAEVASLKNTMIYFVEGNSPEYKYSLIIKKNIELLKDICNCLGLILTMFAHKSHGLPVDTSLNALTRAKNIILGNLINEDDNPKYSSITNIAKNYSSSDLHAYKESGWIIIQGLCSMDRTWLSNNSKTFFFLWKYIFSASSCEINEGELSSPEYKDALATEFFVKKAALASLRKFILSCQEDFERSTFFASNIQKILSNALRFFIPCDKANVIYFYKSYLTADYQEAKMFLYDCLYSIPPSLYADKFNSILYPLSDEIISNLYTDSNYEHIYNCLNQLDNFMCNHNLDIDKCKKEPELIVDNFVVDKFNFKLTNLMSKSFQFVFSAIKLLVEIMLNSDLEVKNRKMIFKHLLSNITEIAMKTTTKTDIGNYNKFVNIAITIYLIIKQSCIRTMYIINDEGIFTNSKMIFDFCFKIEDNNLLRLIACEGHSYLIKASQNPKSNLEYYLTANECKFKNDTHLSHSDLINTFYLISNIFRNVSFKDISVYLDNYMNFIISNFNRIEEILSNPFVPQSIYIIMNVLITNDQIDHARKLIEIFKMNFLFINRDNSQFFKSLFEINSLTEIRLMLILCQLNENIKSNEFELLKLILMKYIKDEKYKSKKIQKNFLLFAKVLLRCHQKFKELIFNESFISFLFKEKNGFYDQKLSLEILIILLSGDYKFDQGRLKGHIEGLVNYINNLYNNNNNFYFNHEIFKRNFRHLYSDTMIFDKNSIDLNRQGIASLIDFDNFSHHNFDVLYKNYHLIKLGKTIIRLYLEKNYLNVVLLLNIIKELVLNQLILYSSQSSKSKETKSDSLKGDDDGDNNKNQTLITIRELNYSIHLGLKKFIIKTIQTCLCEALDKILLTNKASLVEVLNYFMGSSMVLVTCEESWEIKILGIELLSEIIKRFSGIIDTRAEDNSLLIQQYEAQISSCIKIIFNNTISIKSVYKGLKLLYMFITVPISTDSNYIKKVSHLVDINNLSKNEFSITSGGANSTSFSEKADHLLICKKLVFFCKLYLSSKNQKNITLNIYDTINSHVSQVDIYSQYITAPYRSSIDEFFTSNFPAFFNSIVKMLHDFYIVLTFDNQSSLKYKDFNFIFNGNRITYSEHKLIKYGQIFIKVLSILLNDKKSFEENLPKIDKIEEIVQLILHYVNYYILKCGSNSLINTDEIADNIKVSLSLDSVMMIELVDSFAKILSNEYNSFDLGKEEIFNIINLCLNLINFSIDELNYTVLILLECLLRKNLAKSKDSLTKDDKALIVRNISKILYYYKNHTVQIKNDNSVFVEITNLIIEFTIINYIEFKDISTEIRELFYHNLSFLLDCFLSYSPQMSKICAGKLFSSMLLIKDTDILDIYLTTINDALPSLTKQFDKFFIMFYLTIQFLSKTTMDELSTEAFDFIIGTIIQKRLEEKEYMLLVIKSLLIGISQSFDDKMKKVIEAFIIMLLENNYLLPFFIDDMQNIILSYVLTIEDPSKRKEILLMISLTLVDHREVFDLMKLSVVLLKLFTKDMDYFKSEEIYGLFDNELQKQIESLIEMQKKYEKEQEENKKKEEDLRKANENSRNKQSNQKTHQSPYISKTVSEESSQQGKSSGPKIKALKIKK